MASETITRNDLTAILNEVLPSTSVASNVWTGANSVGASTTTTFDNGGLNIASTNYTTNTGHFVMIGFIPLKTSRYTSRALIKVDNTIVAQAGTNKTTLTTVAPVAVYKGAKGATYNVSFAIGSQDSGTTASIETYNYCTFIIFDISDDNNGLLPMEDYVIEQGTDGIWTYRKWNSGVAECWGHTPNDSRSITSSYGNQYYANLNVPLPSGLFTSVSSAVGCRSNIDGSGAALISISISGASTSSLSTYIYCSASFTGNAGFSFEVKGRWK